MRSPLPPRRASNDALASEALRLNDRYLGEVVVGFGLCPWAEAALRQGQVARRVLTERAPAAEAALPFVDELESPGASHKVVGLLIFPQLDCAAPAFDRFVEAVRRADRARRRPGVLPSFVLASFHPDAATSFENAYQLVSFIRRTPDPTIQLVRHETVEAARRGSPGVSDQITAHNFAGVTETGPERLDAVLRDIRRDRDATYARLSSGS